MMLRATVNRSMPDQIVDAIIGVMGIVIGGVIVYFTGRKKNNADAAEAITNAATTLLGPLTKRVDELETKVRCQNEKIERYGQRVIVLMRGIERLVLQITRLGHVPDWTPGEWSPDDEEG